MLLGILVSVRPTVGVECAAILVREPTLKFPKLSDTPRKFLSGRGAKWRDLTLIHATINQRAMTARRPLVGEYACVIGADRRIRLPADWTRERNAEVWLMTPSFLDDDVLVVMPGGDGEAVLEKLRTAARAKGLAENVVTTIRWSAKSTRLALTASQRDWLGYRTGKIVLIGLLTKAHLMTPETRHSRELTPDGRTGAMQAAGI